MTARNERPRDEQGPRRREGFRRADGPGGRYQDAGTEGVVPYGSDPIEEATPERGSAGSYARGEYQDRKYPGHGFSDEADDRDSKEDRPATRRR